MIPEGERTIRANTIGKFVKKARLNRDLTQQYVANKLGYSTAQFISNWERGLAMPPLDVLPKLVALYQIKPEALVAAINEFQEQLLAQQKQQIKSLLLKKARAR